MDVDIVDYVDVDREVDVTFFLMEVVAIQRLSLCSGRLGLVVKGPCEERVTATSEVIRSIDDEPKS